MTSAYKRRSPGRRCRCVVLPCLHDRETQALRATQTAAQKIVLDRDVLENARRHIMDAPASGRSVSRPSKEVREVGGA